MKKIAIVCANAQGIITIDDNGRAQMQRYDKVYQSNQGAMNNRIKKTAQRVETETLHLNMIQRQMYRRLMYGLKEYSPEQIAAMSPSALSRIVEDYKKSKRALHVMKAKKHFRLETKLLNEIFKHCPIGDRDYDWFDPLPKEVTLRSLGISTKEVVDEFIKRKLLPKNFYSITNQSPAL